MGYPSREETEVSLEMLSSLSSRGGLGEVCRRRRMPILGGNCVGFPLWILEGWWFHQGEDGVQFEVSKKIKKQMMGYS